MMPNHSTDLKELRAALLRLSIPDDEKASATTDDEKANLEQNQMEQAHYERYSRKTELIEEYAGKLFWFMVTWATLIFFVIFLVGTKQIGRWTVHFDLPDKVLITLIGATTIQVVGLFASVAYYLYKSDKD